METGKERTVSVEEVKENGYTLSVSSYIYEEPQRETIDPGKIQRDAQMAFLSSLRAQLDFEKTIAEMDGGSIQPLIAEIEAIISEYKAAG
jgi:type I restriction-modification system DNA methylase subunit